MLAALMLTWVQATTLPPARYDHPFPNMGVQRATPDQIRRWCGHPFARACAFKMGDKCTILLPPDVPIGGRVYRHERAHCNGWSKDHNN